MGGVLLFDLDGTLTDPREGITRCIRHALESVGAAVPAQGELEQWIGPPLHHSLRTHLGDDDEGSVASAMSAFRERFATVGLFENAVYPDIPATLAALKERGWTLFVATSKPTVFAERIIDHFDLAAPFSGVYGSELSGERSDKGELIGHLLRTERIAASRATMIGDRALDIVGAKRNDVRGLGVLWGYGSKTELVDAGADAIFATVPDLSLALHDADS